MQRKQNIRNKVTKRKTKKRVLRKKTEIRDRGREEGEVG